MDKPDFQAWADKIVNSNELAHQLSAREFLCRELRKAFDAGREFEQQDLVSEIEENLTRRNPDFPEMVKQAEERRKK